ncbi:MAG: ABC transporter permease, partial [Candidatus Limnocylindria bacterium]
MRAALVIAAKDLRQRLRDRSAIIVAVIAPFGLAAIFGLLLGGTEDGLDLRYAYVDLDGSAISSALRDGALAGLEEAGVATIIEVDSRDAAEAAIDAGDVSAALIVPAGYASAVQSAETADLQIIGSTQAGLATDILQAVSTSFTAELDGIRVATGTAASAMGITDPAAIGELGARAAHTTSPLTVQAVDSELQQIVPATFYAASMAIFFLFFTAQFGVLSLLTERRQGTLPRLVAAPISPSAIVLGKAIGSF